MIRFFTVLCGFLLLANLAVLFWPNTARTAPHIYSSKPDINPHFVRLNKEIEDKYLAVQPGAVMDEETALLVASDAAGCFRLGPFLHLANYELAQAVLFNADVNYLKTTRAASESDMYRVFLGPYDNQPEATDMRVELKRKNVLDHFVRKEADKQYIVSLGIYSNEEIANNAVAQFESKLDSVKLKQEVVVLPDSYWLHFRIGENDQIRQQLASMDWGEQSAKLGKFPCQAGL